MSNTNIQLELAVSVKKVDLAIRGSISNQDELSIMSLFCELPDAKNNVSEILAEEGEINNIITPFIPKKLNFGVYKLSNKSVSISAFQIAAHYDNFKIQGVISKQIKLFSVGITEEISLKSLPLVGEYLKDYTIKNLELVYISKAPNSNNNLTSLINYTKKQFVDNDIWIENDEINLGDAFSAGLVFKSGNDEKKITYPGFNVNGINVTSLPISNENKINSKGNKNTPSSNDKPPLVKINEIVPSIVNNDSIQIAISAEFNIGAFGLQLVGLGIKVPFSVFQDFSLEKLWKDIEFSLQGMALIYDTPALGISGGFLREFYSQKSVIQTVNALIDQINTFVKITKDHKNLFLVKEYNNVKAKTLLNIEGIKKLNEISESNLELQNYNSLQTLLIDLDNNLEKLKQLDTPEKTIEEYNGLLTFRMGKIEIIAIGSYIKTPTYSSLFAFGYLGIPIPVDPAFYIHGFALGFGMNRNFLMPNINEVPNFPLVKLVHQGGLKQGDSIKKVFSNLNRYLPACEDTYVIVAGIKFDSYKMIYTTGIVAVAFGNKTSFNLLGLSTMKLEGVYNFEFAFSMRADVDEGTFLAQGQLSDNSYILLPQLKLTGGFALGMWLKGKNSGDFVFSIGGYHPKFDVPSHYPNNIHRLGFDFNLGPVQLYGKAYFALTPSCIMAGIDAGLRVVLNGGVVYAEVGIAFKADFIIYWKPFYYEAEISVQIYAKVVIDVWLFSINSSFSLAAKLFIKGPEFRGIAVFEVVGYELEVKFGNHNSAIDKTLTQVDFISAYLPEAKNIISYNIISGIIKKIKNADGTESIVVNPKTFSLEVYSEIPITEIEGAQLVKEELKEKNPIYPLFDNSNALVNKLNLKVKGATVDFKSFVLSPIYKSVPKSIWNSKNQLSEKDCLSNDNLLDNVCKGIRLEFSKVISEIKEVKVSLYDYLEKDIQLDNKPLAVNLMRNGKLNNTTMLDFGILNEEEIDFTDLESDISVYKYKESYLGTYKVAM